MDYKQRIKDRGLKINWVAEQIGIGRSLLSQYLNGLRNMPDHIESKLKVILG
jgi:transcriptional regulator with XRE-family HTH domain